MDYQHIVYEPGAVARIILNGPQYRNAQSQQMIWEMDDAFRRAGSDRQVLVIILSGAGSTFCAGHDLGTPEDLAFRKQRDLPPERLAGYIEQRELYVEATLRWRNVPKPTIAMVHGYCIFAAVIDLIFAADDALCLAMLNADVAALKVPSCRAQSAQEMERPPSMTIVLPV